MIISGVHHFWLDLRSVTVLCVCVVFFFGGGGGGGGGGWGLFVLFKIQSQR